MGFFKHLGATAGVVDYDDTKALDVIFVPPSLLYISALVYFDVSFIEQRDGVVSYVSQVMSRQEDGIQPSQVKRALPPHPAQGNEAARVAAMQVWLMCTAIEGCCGGIVECPLPLKLLPRFR